MIGGHRKGLRTWLLAAVAGTTALLPAACSSIGSTVGGGPGQGKTVILPRQVLNVVWRVGLVDSDVFSSKFQHRGTPAVSPDGSRLVVGASDGTISCLRSQDGALLWRKRVEGPTDSEALIENGVVYLAAANGNALTYRLKDGKLLWQTTLPGPGAARPVVAGDKLLVMTTVNELVCLRKNDGKWLWSHKRSFRSDRFKVLGAARPLVVGDVVYGGFSDGQMVKLDLKDGSVLQSRQLVKGGATFADVDVDPVMVGGSLLTGSASGGVLALDPATLEQRWNYDIDAPSDLAVEGNRVFVTGGDGSVACLQAGNGKEVWKVNPDQEGLLSAPVIASGGWLLVSSEDVSLLVFHRPTGTRVQVFNPGKGASAPPAVWKNRAFWVSNGETVYAMAISR